MRSSDIRERLGLSRADWARALNVNVMTVKRWEDDGTDPGGLASEVMRAITNALDDGADAKLVSRKVSLGIGSLLFHGLISQARPPKTA